MNNPDKLIKLGEAERIMRKVISPVPTRPTLISYIKNGTLKGQQLGGNSHYYVFESSLTEFMRSKKARWANECGLFLVWGVAFAQPHTMKFVIYTDAEDFLDILFYEIVWKLFRFCAGEGNFAGKFTRERTFDFIVFNFRVEF